MRWIGEHIWDLVSRFRQNVYLEKLGPSNSEFPLVWDLSNTIGSDGKANKYKLAYNLELPNLRGSMFTISGNEGSFNENRWLIPRRYKDGAYLSGASEDFSAAELATISFDTHMRIQSFIGDGVKNPHKIILYTAMDQTSLANNLEFGLFISTPSPNDLTLTYTFYKLFDVNIASVSTGIRKTIWNGPTVITPLSIEGVIYSYGFHNPAHATPINQDIDNLKYWATIYC
tara:strand:- start:320 stop:1006 length:687 start_codon:yes stop_codon:yes gene_type:complete